jgi:hypothetical protein
VSKKEDADAGRPSGANDLSDLGRDFRAIRDLAQDTDLHVVHDESEALWVARLLETLGHLQPVCLLHCTPSFQRVVNGRTMHV